MCLTERSVFEFCFMFGYYSQVPFFSEFVLSVLCVFLLSELRGLVEIKLRSDLVCVVFFYSLKSDIYFPEMFSVCNHNWSQQKGTALVKNRKKSIYYLSFVLWVCDLVIKRYQISETEFFCVPSVLMGLDDCVIFECLVVTHRIIFSIIF